MTTRPGVSRIGKSLGNADIFPRPSAFRIAIFGRIPYDVTEASGNIPHIVTLDNIPVHSFTSTMAQCRGRRTSSAPFFTLPT